MLILDSNETTTGLTEYFDQNSIPYKKEQIRIDGVRIGDITNDKRMFVLEHKKLDYWNIGHTKSQVEKLTQLEIPVAVVHEGSRKKWIKNYYACRSRIDAFSRPKFPSVNWGKSFCAEMFLFYGVPMLFFDTLKELVDYCLLLDSRKKKVDQPIVKQRIKGPDPALSLLCQIDTIGVKMAIELIERFGSPLRVFLASDDELNSVPKMGPKRIKKIREAVE